MPAGLVRILDRDLHQAGISKRDERGRTVDVHALRHTFGALLSKGGVAPRTAQAAMRHSSIELTMNVYTDPKLLDMAGAVESLPALPLGAGPQGMAVAARATGTDALPLSPLAPVLAPTLAKPSALQSIVDKAARETAGKEGGGLPGEKVLPIKRLRPLSIVDNGRFPVGATGLEPATSCTPSKRAKPDCATPRPGRSEDRSADSHL